MTFDTRLRFENFVVGSANRLAVAAARAVAEAPGAVYNPLFIYGGSGLGKTHLLAAIGSFASELQPGLGVEYVTLDEFVEQLHASISTGTAETLKQRYQRIDLLLLDDVQFLTGRRETQSEMLRLFNTMQGGGKQIILTSDRPPSEIADVDERLITRLSGGLTVDIGSPDYETRVAIVRNKCDERGVSFGPGVIEELARTDFGNVRDLQGALNRLVAQQTLGGGAVRVSDVREVVGEREPPPEPAHLRVSGGGEFQSFLSDMALAVAQHVELWKTRLGEAIAYWSGEGYRVGVLERALRLPHEPDVEGLLNTYVAAIEHLRALESQASAIDPALGASEAFRDPERVPEAEDLVERALAGDNPPPGPSSAFSRMTFEVGPSNQLAVRAAEAVVEEPGQRYNPLFIHGPSGVGKTHLINALGNEMIEASGGATRVSCVGAQLFIDELIGALQDGEVERWRARYRAADLLILDDVHFVAGKERTQEELFHVFNAMHSLGKQIVLSSDRPPKELDQLEERLRSRFEGGLVVAIQPPDHGLREKLYARFLAHADVDASPQLLSYLAERPVASVRELHGVVHRLVAAADVSGAEISLSLARAELEGAGTAPVPAPAPRHIAGDAFFLDDEKVVWDWPEIGARVIEELR